MFCNYTNPIDPSPNWIHQPNFSVPALSLEGIEEKLKNESEKVRDEVLHTKNDEL